MTYTSWEFDLRLDHRPSTRLASFLLILSACSAPRVIPDQLVAELDRGLSDAVTCEQLRAEKVPELARCEAKVGERCVLQGRAHRAECQCPSGQWRCELTTPEGHTISEEAFRELPLYRSWGGDVTLAATEPQEARPVVLTASDLLRRPEGYWADVPVCPGRPANVVAVLDQDLPQGTKFWAHLRESESACEAAPIPACAALWGSRTVGSRGALEVTEQYPLQPLIPMLRDAIGGATVIARGRGGARLAMTPPREPGVHPVVENRFLFSCLRTEYGGTLAATLGPPGPGPLVVEVPPADTREVLSFEPWPSGTAALALAPAPTSPLPVSREALPLPACRELPTGAWKEQRRWLPQDYVDPNPSRQRVFELIAANGDRIALPPTGAPAQLDLMSDSQPLFGPAPVPPTAHACLDSEGAVRIQWFDAYVVQYWDTSCKPVHDTLAPRMMVRVPAGRRVLTRIESVVEHYDSCRPDRSRPPPDRVDRK